MEICTLVSGQYRRLDTEFRPLAAVAVDVGERADGTCPRDPYARKRTER